MTPSLSPDLREALLNDFGLRCFRDVADGDYITARMAFRADLLIQAYWGSQQALEKYLKGILLFRRITRCKATHRLGELLTDLEKKFSLDLHKTTREFIDFIDGWEIDRYFIFPYYSEGLELVKLDTAVWDLRRYCDPVDRRLSPTGKSADELDLRRIRDASKHPPQRFRPTVAGLLEEIRHNKKHPAHTNLIWKNLYFHHSARKSISIRQSWFSTNSPLSLHPEIIDEVKRYVFLPKNADALRNRQ